MTTENAQTILESLCTPAKVRDVSIENEKVHFSFQCLKSGKFENYEKIKVKTLLEISLICKGKTIKDALEEQTDLEEDLIDYMLFWQSKFTCCNN